MGWSHNLSRGFNCRTRVVAAASALSRRIRLSRAQSRAIRRPTGTKLKTMTNALSDDDDFTTHGPGTVRHTSSKLVIELIVYY